MDLNPKWHFVRFYFANAITADITDVPTMPAAGITVARLLAAQYSRAPYAFEFVTRSRGPDEMDSKETYLSPTYYLGGEAYTFEQIAARDDPNDRILLENMSCNKWNRVILTPKGQIRPLNDDDVVLATQEISNGSPAI
jgi:hypothetical protein